jgi:hypothetical protein
MYYYIPKYISFFAMYIYGPVHKRDIIDIDRNGVPRLQVRPHTHGVQYRIIPICLECVLNQMLKTNNKHVGYR